MQNCPSSVGNSKYQQGGAMLVMIVVLVIGVVSILVTSLSATSLENRRNRTTAEALAKAKEALIGYAITYGDAHPGSAHGYLPCPDIDGTPNGEGSSPGSCGLQNVNQLGRFPWRTLDLPDLYDGTGECLWYAVSGTYKNNPPTGNHMNWDNVSQLQVFAEDGTEINAGDIVAVVIAPDLPLSTNSSRAAGTAPTCGGNYTPSAYLDRDTNHGIIDNADISQGKFILPHEHRDANGNVTLSTNDKFVFITKQDIWKAVEQRVLKEARKCLNQYATVSGNKYPWPAPISTGAYVSTINTYFGRIPESPGLPFTTSDPMVNAMFDYLTDLQTALDNYAANNNATTRTALDTAGDNLNNTADDILDAGTYPTYLNDVAMPARSAGSRAEHLANGDLRWNGSSWVPYTVSYVQERIDAANAAIALLPTSLPDVDMLATWQPATCFTSIAGWDDWKEMVFYQIASGYAPGSSANCTVSGSNTCLSQQVSGQTSSGSPNFRAVLVGAGKKLTANRVSTTIGDYVEGTNQLPQSNVSNPFISYRVTDGEYQSINDQILCVDDGTYCL